MSFTTITDTLKNADGSGFTGILTIYPLGSTVAVDKVPVAAGALVVKLQPGNYVAVGEMAGQTSGIFEHWIVSPTSTSLASVRGILDASRLTGLIPATAVNANGPTGRWQKWNVAVNGANFDITAPDGSVTSVAIAAALTQNVVVFAIPTKGAVDKFIQAPSVAFAGTTTLTNTLGTTGSATLFLSTPFDLTAAVSNSNFAGDTPVVGTDTLVGTNFVLALTATVDTLDHLSAGSLNIWVKYSVRP